MNLPHFLLHLLILSQLVSELFSSRFKLLNLSPALLEPIVKHYS
jgi:hypothetical protein